MGDISTMVVCVTETEPLPVTVVIPVKNEERNLPACLAQLDTFKEVVVVDSDSSDSTVSIAQTAGARILQFHWNGKFPKKRNWVLQTFPFQTPWVLFLDADEIVTPEFKAELRSVIGNIDHVGFWLKYRNHFLGRVLKYGVEQRKLALFRIGAGHYERIDDERWSDLDMEVHEHPVLDGSVGEVLEPLEHKDFRDLHHYIARHNEYSSWEARRYLALRGDSEAWSMLTRRQKLKYRFLSYWWFAPAYFLATYMAKRGFLDGRAGYVHAAMKMGYFFQIYCKIRTLQTPDAEHSPGCIHSVRRR
jgi:glycosyltransferase involved in cell wall biosynthesis